MNVRLDLRMERSELLRWVKRTKSRTSDTLV